MDTSHLNPLPDQEAPTGTAFHRARYSGAQPWRTSLVPRSFLNLQRLKRSGWASLGHSRLPRCLSGHLGSSPHPFPSGVPRSPCRPPRDGAGPLLGHITHYEGLQSSEPREGCLTPHAGSLLYTWVEGRLGLSGWGRFGGDGFLIPQQQASMRDPPPIRCTESVEQTASVLGEHANLRFYLYLEPGLGLWLRAKNR